MPRTSIPAWTASMLRRDLNERAASLARAHGYLHDLCPGASPVVIFGRDEQGRHGNFHPAAYAAICTHPEWIRRLAKVHTASRRSRARKDWQWMELDSASSSDALLMNIFCHPEVFDRVALAAPVAALRNVDATAQPRFAARPGVPLLTPLKARTKKVHAERLDRTEIDLTLSGPTATLFVEAKLTESDFQTAAPSLVERYRDLEAVFDIDRLPTKLSPARPSPAATPSVPHPSQSDRWDEVSSHSPDPDFPEDSFLNLPNRPPKQRIAGYQLIRNVLAAFAADASFCVLCDARRHDLIESWYAILSAVHSQTFACRLKLLTWQELAAALPRDLQHFLEVKYGVTP